MYISTSALFRSKSKHVQFQNRFSGGSIPGGLRNMEPKRPYIIVCLCLKCKGLFFFDPLSSRQNMRMFINAKWLTSRAKLAGQARLCTKTSFIWNSSFTRKKFKVLCLNENDLWRSQCGVAVLAACKRCGVVVAHCESDKSTTVRRQSRLLCLLLPNWNVKGCVVQLQIIFLWSVIQYYRLFFLTVRRFKWGDKLYLKRPSVQSHGTQQ